MKCFKCGKDLDIIYWSLAGDKFCNDCKKYIDEIREELKIKCPQFFKVGN